MSFSAIDDKILTEAGVIDPVTVYNKIANIGGFGVTVGFRPTLDLSGLAPDQKSLVDKVIAEAMPKTHSKTTKEND